jgi:hypothetical protein
MQRQARCCFDTPENGVFDWLAPVRVGSPALHAPAVCKDTKRAVSRMRLARQSAALTR